MAGSSQKKTIQRNTATLTFLTTYTLVSLFLWVAIHLLMVFVLRQWPQVPSTGTLFLFTLQNSASIYIISCLRAWSRDGALDLGGKGVVEYLQDLVYIGWFVTLGSLYSTKIYYIYLAIPLYGVYWVGKMVLPFFFRFGSTVGPVISEDASDRSSSSSSSKKKVRVVR